MTTLNVTLSGTLQNSSHLGQPGVWAYAAVAQGDALSWTTLVNNGTILNGGSDAITLPGTYDGGKVYFLVQSEGTAHPDDLPTLIQKQGDINFNNAAAYDFRFDSFEVSLLSTANDAGNLTAVNGFGLPMELSVPYSDGTTATVGYNITADTLVQDIQNINTGEVFTSTYTVGPLAGQFRMATSPAEAVGQGGTSQPFTSADWAGYVQSLEVAGTTGITGIELSGMFNGAPDHNNVWHNGGYYSYQLRWDSTNSVFWLEPIGNSQIQGDIKLSPAQLENSIYSTLGTMDIYQSETGAPYAPASGETTGWNDQWGNVVKALVVGFTGGFYGQEGDASKINPQNAGTVDLNQNINWDPTFAFGNFSITPPPSGYQTSDPYAKIFFDNTNVYGAGYADALTSGFAVGGPLISVSEPGQQANVPNINLTIFADGEQPSGYVQPQVFNYIAPPGGGYAVPSTTDTNNAAVVLNFAAKLGTQNAGVVPAKTDTITLNILASDAGNTPTWKSLTIDGSKAGPDGLWQLWNISEDGSGNFTATPQPSSTHPTGVIEFFHFPTATSGTSWFQITVGSKTFNLYTKTGSDGLFLNPAFSGQQGSLAIDGLATLAPEASTAQTIRSFTVNLAGNAVTYDPSLMVVNTDSAAVAALAPVFAPVVGTLNGGTFVAVAGQINPNTNSVTATVADLAFGWTGLNPLAGTPDPDPTKANQWIASFTNKIDPLTVARVSVALHNSGTVIASSTGTADLDGRWQTGTVHLSNGTYDVTMQEFLSSDTAFASPLTPASQVLQVTVACFAQGTLITTEAGVIPVEQVAIGARVPTCAGRGMARVIWTGHRTIDCRRHPRPDEVMPVRICQGAFGQGLPRTDLILSPDHAVYVAGVLIPVRHLLNGSTVRQEQADVVTYYHVELERHDIILATGLPVESFLDTGNRSAFSSNGNLVQLHPDFSALTWEAAGCAPLVVAGPPLNRLRAMLAERAEMLSASAAAA